MTKLIGLGFAILGFHGARRQSFLESRNVACIRGNFHVCSSFSCMRIAQHQSQSIRGTNIALVRSHAQEGNASFHILVAIALDNSKPAD